MSYGRGSVHHYIRADGYYKKWFHVLAYVNITPVFTHTRNGPVSVPVRRRRSRRRPPPTPPLALLATTTTFCFARGQGSTCEHICVWVQQSANKLFTRSLCTVAARTGVTPPTTFTLWTLWPKQCSGIYIRKVYIHIYTYTWVGVYVGCAARSCIPTLVSLSVPGEKRGLCVLIREIRNHGLSLHARVYIVPTPLLLLSYLPTRYWYCDVDCRQLV